MGNVASRPVGLRPPRERRRTAGGEHVRAHSRRKRGRPERQSAMTATLPPRREEGPKGLEFPFRWGPSRPL